MKTKRRIKLGENLSPEAKANLAKLLEKIGDNFEITIENLSTAFSKEMKNSFKVNGEDYFSVLSSNSQFLSRYSDVNSAYLSLEDALKKLQDVTYQLSEELTN